MKKFDVINVLENAKLNVGKKQQLAITRTINIVNSLNEDVEISEFGLKDKNGYNLGKICEVVLKSQLGFNARFSPQGEKDIDRVTCPEIKTCLVGNQYGVNLESVTSGITLITSDGVYTLNYKVVSMLKHLKPENAVKITVDSKKNYTLKLKSGAKVYGKYNKYMSNLIGL